MRILGDIAPRFLQPPAAAEKEQSSLWGINPGELQYPHFYNGLYFYGCLSLSRPQLTN